MAPGRRGPWTLPGLVWLGLGLVAIVGFGVAFAGILDAVQESDGITRLDRPVTTMLATHRTAGLTTVVTTITRAGNAVPLITITAAVALLLAVLARAWRPVWLVAIALSGSAAAVALIKLIVARPRPDRSFSAILADGYSFPSGHATNSLVAFGVLAFAATTTVVTRRAWQVVVWVVAVTAGVAIGLSRVYLGVHFLSDVLAAFALASGWILVIAVADTVSRRRSASSASTVSA